MTVSGPRRRSTSHALAALLGIAIFLPLLAAAAPPQWRVSWLGGVVGLWALLAAVLVSWRGKG